MSEYAMLDMLTAALWAHLQEYGLPRPISVSLNFMTAEITVQAGGVNPVAELAELLAWAASLRAVDAEWWHTPGGNLHVTITGQTAAGVRIKAFGGTDYEATAGLAGLVAGPSERVTLGELATLAELLRESSVQVDAA